MKRSRPVDLGFAAEDLLNDALAGDTLSLSSDAVDTEKETDEEKLAKGKVSRNQPKSVQCTLTSVQILSISIYIQWGSQHQVPFGKRAIVYKGLADFEMIVQEEVARKHIKRVQEESNERGEMLVMGEIPLADFKSLLTDAVSGSDALRDQLRRLVRGHVDEKVRLEELEYQPSGQGD